MNKLIHITPQLPPAFDGVGDYCWNLWRHWPERDTRWHFAVLHGAGASQQAWPAVTIHGFDASAESLLAALEASGAATAVLHYVGYGYQPKGIPLWLPRAMEEWRDNPAHPERRLITMFHEMYARSSPLRSPFWVKPWAAQIIRDLVDCSDGWVTNCSEYRQWLISEFDADRDCGRLIPIGSNLPAARELHEDRLWPAAYGRKLRIVIFGLPNTRLWALEKHARLLHHLVSGGLVEAILLCGKSTRDRRYARRITRYQRDIGGQWRTEHDLACNEASDVLAGCDLGLIANNAGTLTKSGVFAAMATNGVICVIDGASPAGCALPSAYADAVLVNDDREDHLFPSLAAELQGVNRMTARRRSTLRLARTELSWSNVAERWQHALANVLQAPAIERVPLPRGMLAPHEVRV